MTFDALLIANRGEIAIRIARAAGELGLRTVAVHSEDDAESLHVHAADGSRALAGIGAAAYLDEEAVIGAAQAAGCGAIHPGYGFLAERAGFARRCAAAGIVFIGPNPAHLELFGDKGRARTAAVAAGVPVLNGIDAAVSLEQARDFFASLSGRPMIVKAVAGGGGRGTRVVETAEDLEAAYERCRSEARASFGIADVYVEEFLPRARHVEVQILGDLHGGVTHLGERECSVQRRHQKIVEVAPAPGLSEELRDAVIDAAVRFAGNERYTNLGTFEFLVDASGSAGERPFVFIETNARLQVEHTVTEEVTGVDLVQAQIHLADGASLEELGLEDASAHAPRGYAIQARVNMETIGEDGSVRPASGTLTAYEAPSGPGVRTDGFGYAGYRTSTAFDSLLAKVVGYSPSRDFSRAIARTARALSEFRLEGVGTNLPFLRNVLRHEDFAAGRVHTRWVDERVAELAVPGTEGPNRFVTTTPAEPESGQGGYAGARVDSADPLALFDHDARVKSEQAPSVHVPEAPEVVGPEGAVGLSSPIQGTIVSVDVAVDDAVRKGQQVAVIEAMKMEHVIAADRDGIVRRITMAAGDVVRESYPIVFVEEAEVSGEGASAAEEIDPDHIRDDLRQLYERHALVLDENRPEAVEKRYGRGYRMPRENIDQLMDPGSFKEYWPLIVARQHKRYDMDTLRRDTPADGLIAGIGTINGDLFDAEQARAMVVHYDYTVLAGTQGGRNHYKQDRMFELASRFRIPVVLFGEGGGGRPGDDSIGPGVAFDTHTFTQFSKLSGLVPMVSVINGRTFAGNTALVACCDVIIATERTTVAMGGPAMIEGRRSGHLHARGSRPDVVSGPERRRGHPDEGRGGSGRGREEVPVLLPGAHRQLGGARPAAAAPRRTGEPPAPVRHARDRPHDRGRGFGTRDSGEVRHWRHHGVHPGRRPFDGCHRQQPAPPRRRHRLGRRGQGCAFHPALRRLRHSGAEPDGLPGHDGRPGRRAHGARAPLRADVQRRRQPDDAALRGGRAQGLRARCAGHVRRQCADGIFHRRLADRGVRGDEH